MHRAELIRAPDADDLDLLEQVARQGPVLLTIAPEMVPDDALARLARAGVVLSAGHSAASFERTEAAVGSGVSGFTHLFNAMPPLAARSPGIAAAALATPGTWCGVIADGIHVHPAMLRLVLGAKAGRVVLVSDAMPPTGTDSASFELQGRTIHRAHGALRTADGTLAGADICLADAVRFCVRALGLPIAEALMLATAAPADFLGVSATHGRLGVGLRADFVLFSPALAVLQVWQEGRPIMP